MSNRLTITRRHAFDIPAKVEHRVQTASAEGHYDCPGVFLQVCASWIAAFAGMRLRGTRAFPARPRIVLKALRGVDIVCG
jgi:hypothetical protein